MHRRNRPSIGGFPRCHPRESSKETLSNQGKYVYLFVLKKEMPGEKHGSTTQFLLRSDLYVIQTM